jgi:hypothetical protein
MTKPNMYAAINAAKRGQWSKITTFSIENLSRKALGQMLNQVRNHADVCDEQWRVILLIEEEIERRKIDAEHLATK